MPSYGAVTPAVAKAIRSCLSDPSGSLRMRELDAFGRDKSMHPPSSPQLVALPRTTGEVAAVLQICNQHRVPVTPRGAGTGLEGGAIPLRGGVVLSTERLTSLSIDVQAMQATVGAGVRKIQLNRALAKHGLIFGPDPASNPSVGGMVSTSGSGLSTLKYGTTRENVVSLVVATPTGGVFRTRQKVRKASTGYELTQLYIGSEGTLGVVTEVTVRLFPKQPRNAGATGVFPSLRAAAQAVVDLLPVNRPSLVRCELLNSVMIRATNAAYKTQLEAAPTLFLEFEGPSTAAVRADWQRVLGVLRRHGVRSEQYSEDKKTIDKLWGARRGCYWSVVKYRKLTQGLGKIDLAYITDVCVPTRSLAACIAETEADFEKEGLPCLICAHISGAPRPRCPSSVISHPIRCCHPYTLHQLTFDFCVCRWQLSHKYSVPAR